MIVQVFRTLVEHTRGIKGIKVENHKFCASIHYRNVDERVRITFFSDQSLLQYKTNCHNWWFFDSQDWPSVAHCVQVILEGYPRLKITHGRKVTSFSTSLPSHLSRMHISFLYLIEVCYKLSSTNSVILILFLMYQVLEVRPVIDWNKGNAVEFLLDSLGNTLHFFNISRAPMVDRGIIL